MSWNALPAELRAKILFEVLEDITEAYCDDSRTNVRSIDVEACQDPETRRALSNPQVYQPYVIRPEDIIALKVQQLLGVSYSFVQELIYPLKRLLDIVSTEIEEHKAIERAMRIGTGDLNAMLMYWSIRCAQQSRSSKLQRAEIYLGMAYGRIHRVILCRPITMVLPELKGQAAYGMKKGVRRLHRRLKEAQQKL